MQPDPEAHPNGSSQAPAKAVAGEKLVYLVHDLRDPAVERRVRMLQEGGIVPSVLGFHRSKAPARLCGLPATDLGRTVNGHLGQRARTVVQTALGLGRWQRHFEGARVIMARNLEMLLLAALARRYFAPEASLVYECLDVHSALVNEGPQGRALRTLEGMLLRRCQMLIASSPAFVSSHFNRRYGSIPPVMLLENKLLHSELQPATPRDLPAARPWRIGWFGVIRCRRSLELLSALCRARPGLVEVVIRGRIARNVLPDFDEIVATTPGMTFLGVYDRCRDLAAIYGDVHFAWAMDFYEAGFNSTWLLPNRLYEGTLHGAIPLALEGVQTATWLRQRRAGVVLGEPLGEWLEAYFDGLDQQAFQAARTALSAIPTADLVSDRAEAAHLTSSLLSLPPGRVFSRSGATRLAANEV